jgi:hypothetical protein
MTTSFTPSVYIEAARRVAREHPHGLPVEEAERIAERAIRDAAEDSPVLYREIYPVVMSALRSHTET